MRRSTKWNDRDVARYLLAHVDYERWRMDESDMILWITSNGEEVIQMDDLECRSAAVQRFVTSRQSVLRGELEMEFNQEFKIYSVLFSPFSLFSVKQVLEHEFPDAKISIETSQHDGSKRIHVRADDADFEGCPESTGGAEAAADYLFNGCIALTADASVAKAKQLFSRLASAGIEVAYEVYDPNGTTLFEQRPTREGPLHPTAGDTPV